ncbi:hypothetical protein FT663_02605 [Candidozyma haemuli var. vulneris]|nr:hypothetical protein FT663_02605 [[Candida] haemuloni var. vulneris]KAF3992071.1 hypothetical protein FT662_01380 [[Candida] haemuloni var. vulneris]
MSMEKPRFFQPKPKLEPKSISQDTAPPATDHTEDAPDSLFVQEDEDEDVIEVVEEVHSNGKSQEPVRTSQMSSSPQQSFGTSQHPAEENSTLISSQDSNGSDARLSQIGFDLFRSQLISIIGDASSKALQYLYKKYFNRPNYIQLATNEYFNGLDIGADDADPKTAEVKEESEERKEEIKQLYERMRSQAKQDQEIAKATSWQRYIGTLHLEAWATRPYLRALTYKQRLVVKRLIPSKIKKSSKVQAKFGDSAVIRLYTDGTDNREIGRLPEDVTRILSPLIDLDLAHFEATVMMETNKRISIGDPFYISIRCFLNNNTFVNHDKYVGSEDVEDSSPAKKRKVNQGVGFNYSQETDAEAALRLKQKSISRLFEKLQITPFDENAPAVDELVVLDDEPSNEIDTQQENSSVDELSLDQLKDFYTANQHSEYLNDLPETTSPPEENFKLELRPYQKHGLSWMLAREKEIDTLERLSTTDGEVLSTQKRQAIRQEDGVVNPLWSKFKWPSDPNTSDSGETEEYFYANLYNGEMSRDKPMMKSFMKGGILADEMGLGKTISILSLVHSVPYDSSALNFEPPRYASKTTLVVVPMSLLSQWKSEFDRSNNNKNHRCFVYYGDSVQADFSQTLCGRTKNIPVVVLTTYGTVQNEWTRFNKMRDENGKLPKMGLFSVEYFRIVLDEGHTIRNRTTKTAKSAHELESRRKWVLTGTPVINRLDDIFSIVKFLKLEPWSNFSYWKTFVTLPFEQKKFNQTLDVVKSILQPIFLRRTKNMKSKDGQPLISLPDKEVIVQELEFSKREQLYYDFFKTRAFQSFKEGMKSGDLLKKYTQILTHILRLRQICCHADLVSGSDELDETWAQELAEFEKPFLTERFENDTKLKQVMYSLYKRIDLPNSECSICTQSPINVGEMVVTECGHNFCFHCLKEHIDFQSNNGNDPLCPDCRGPISIYRLFKVRNKETDKKEVRFHTNEDVDDPSSKYDFQLYHYDPNKTSSKIEALIEHLIALKDQAPGEQVVVFSQFSSYLDLIENELKIMSNNGTEFEVYKFDGRLNLNDREKILQSFTAERKMNGKVVVLLLSLKAGGVGLNLTCANRAFMMDPWWSPSVEDQAIDRIHRIGQAQNVKVVRFIVKNSIETKMLRIQERKRMMGEAVEVEEEERRKQRIEEIKLLFEE